METDLRLATALDGTIRLLNADRASMRTVPGAVLYTGSVNGTGSDTGRVPFAGLDGFDSFSATAAEDTDITETSLTDASADIAVVRHGIRRDLGDLAALTGPDGNIDVMRLGMSMLGEYEMGWMESLADAIDGFSAISGAGSQDFSVDDFYVSIFTLELADVMGPYYSMLHPRQTADLQGSIRSETGPSEHRTDFQQMLNAQGQGLVGMLAGVVIFKSSKVNTSGGNRLGGMWGAGALGWKNGTPRNVPGAIFIRPNAEVTVELQRDASKALTEIVGHAYYGINVLQDVKGTTVRSSAT